MGDAMELDSPISPTRGLKRKADDAVSFMEPRKVQEPLGGDVLDSTWNSDDETTSLRKFKQKSSSLPFGQPIDFPSVSGPTYITAQTLVQQVAYTLSDKIFSYSPESFDLDVAVKNWSAANTKNANGYTTLV